VSAPDGEPVSAALPLHDSLFPVFAASVRMIVCSKKI